MRFQSMKVKVRNNIIKEVISLYGILFTKQEIWKHITEEFNINLNSYKLDKYFNKYCIHCGSGVWKNKNVGS